MSLSDVIQPPLRIEGTWEQVVAHSDALRGKRVIVTVLDDPRPLTDEENAERHRGLREIWDEVDRLAANPPPTPQRTKPDPFGDALLEEYNQQLAQWRTRRDSQTQAGERQT